MVGALAPGLVRYAEAAASGNSSDASESFALAALPAHSAARRRLRSAWALLASLGEHFRKLVSKHPAARIEGNQSQQALHAEDSVARKPWADRKSTRLN